MRRDRSPQNQENLIVSEAIPAREIAVSMDPVSTKNY
jgi:hypothetical protein